MGMKKMLFGIGIGAIAGLLLAPKKGSELRNDIKETVDKAKDLNKDDLINAVNASYDRVVKAIEEFDLEAIKGNTKEKINGLKVSVEELKEKAKNNQNISEIIQKVTDISANAANKIKAYKEKLADNQEAFEEAVSEVIEEETEQIEEIIEELEDTEE